MTKVTFKYPLWAKIECRQTGLKGIIASVGELVNGAIRYGIQPRTKDGRDCPTQWEIDQHNVKISGKAKIGDWTHEFKFKTGDEVRSRVNGFKGIVIERRLSANGCVDYMVEGQFSKENKRVRVEMFEQEVELLGDGLNKKLEKVKKASCGPCGASKKESFI